MRGCSVYVLLTLCGTGFSTVPYNDVRADFETLLSAYQSTNGGVDVTDVMPKDLSSGPVTVYMGISLYAIMDYDAVSGVIQLVASMKMEWLDEVKNLTGTTFKGGLETIFVGYDQIWSPNLVLMSSIDTIERIGDETYKIRYNVSSGYCKWYPRMIINAACTPDMTYYPFDKQSCTLTVTPWNRGITDLRLDALTDKWNTANMESSGTWSVDTTSTETYIGRNNTRYFVDFKITIKRKPLFLALVIVLPVLLLSLLTGFLFLLPPASGSRVGFGITCFLSFVVLLQTIMSFMPEVSSPMSILCFYVILMLSFSVFLSIANVFLLRLHLNPSKSEVPQYFQIILEIITCKVWRRCPKCPKIKFQFVRKLWNRLRTCKRCKFWKNSQLTDDEDKLGTDDEDISEHTRRNSVLGTRLPVISNGSALRNRFTSDHETGLIRNDDNEDLEKMYDGSTDTANKRHGENSSLLENQGSRVPSAVSGPRVPSAVSGPRVPSAVSDPRVPSAVSGPRVLSAASGPRVPSAVSGPRVPSAVSGSRVQSAVSGPRVPSAVSGPRVPSAASGLRVPSVVSGSRVSSAVSGSRVSSAASSASSTAPKKELTWEYIAEVLDLFFLALFVIVQIIFTIFFLVPLGAQY